MEPSTPQSDLFRQSATLLGAGSVLIAKTPLLHWLCHAAWIPASLPIASGGGLSRDVAKGVAFPQGAGFRPEVATRDGEKPAVNCGKPARHGENVNP